MSGREAFSGLYFSASLNAESRIEFHFSGLSAISASTFASFSELQFFIITPVLPGTTNSELYFRYHRHSGGHCVYKGSCKALAAIIGRKQQRKIGFQRFGAPVGSYRAAAADEIGECFFKL